MFSAEWNNRRAGAVPRPMLLVSRLLDIPHGFSTRVGGASQGPYSSLNLSGTVGDDPHAVEENVRRFANAVAIGRPVLTARQVHGTRMIFVDHGASAELLPPPQIEADALATRSRTVAVGVRTADCTPILVHAPRAGAVAAVHAGWRGTHARVLTQAIEALVRDHGATAAELRIVIGPRIGPCCFEVGEEVAAQFAASPPGVVIRRAARTFVDLGLANRSECLASGVPAGQIEDMGRCTFCEADVFFSHRRDHGTTGRHVSFIALA